MTLVFGVVQIHTSINDTLDTFFRQITTFIKVHVDFVFGLQTLQSNFKIYRLEPGAQKQRPHARSFMNVVI